MVSKKNHSKLSVKDWINVEGLNCVVSQVYGDYCLLGSCEVVTNPTDPINRDVCWDGERWVFSDRPTFVNAVRTTRLREYLMLFLESHEEKIDVADFV